MFQFLYRTLVVLSIVYNVGRHIRLTSAHRRDILCLSEIKRKKLSMAIYALTRKSVSQSVRFVNFWLWILKHRYIELDIMVSLVTRKSVKYYSADVFC